MPVTVWCGELSALLVQSQTCQTFHMHGSGLCACAVGKKELPAVLRSRFTELQVPEPTAQSDLEAIAAAYLAGTAPHPPVTQAVDLYRKAKQAAVRPTMCCELQLCTQIRLWLHSVGAQGTHAAAFACPFY